MTRGYDDGFPPVLPPLPHQPDHSPILAPLPDATPSAALVDAVVVPSKRHPDHLAEAVRLAVQLDVPILVIATEVWGAGIAGTVLRDQRGAVALLPREVRSRFFDLSIARKSRIDGNPHADTAYKRNAALRIGRSLGWRYLLFMDDDVTELAVEEVRVSVAAMDQFGLRAVGWILEDFPDNSVICHLRRDVELRQKIFIGGGALLVDLDGSLPFFPPVYNEDWLFLHDWIIQGGVTAAGTVKQAEFDPFESPDRAAREEFGDLFAEGLFGLMHRHWHIDAARSTDFWAQVQRERRSMLRQVRSQFTLLSGVLAAKHGSDAVRRRQRSWQAAFDELAALQPYVLMEYLEAWRADLETWNGQLAELASAPDLITALEQEELPVLHLNP